MAYTVEQINQMLQGLTPGVGEKYQRVQGSGVVNQDLNQFLGTNPTMFALPGQENGYGRAYANQNEPFGSGSWYSGGEDQGPGAGWQALFDRTSQPKDFQYWDINGSRNEDKVSAVNYFDDKGKHTKSDIYNDPLNSGDETWGDFAKSDYMKLFLAAVGGMMFLPGGMLNGALGGGAGAAGGVGEVGSGAGFIGEGAVSGIPAWDGALAGVGAGEVGAGAGGLSAVDLTGTGLPLDSAGGVVGSQAGGGTLTNGQIMNGINGGGFYGSGPVTGGSGGSGGSGSSGATRGAGGVGGDTAGGSAGGAKGGGSFLSGNAFNIPGIGDVSWMDALKLGSMGLGALAGGQGNQQTTTTSRDLPDYLRGPVTGPNGLLSSADALMQHQMYGRPMRGLI